MAITIDIFNYFIILFVLQYIKLVMMLVAPNSRARREKETVKVKRKWRGISGKKEGGEWKEGNYGGMV